MTVDLPARLREGVCVEAGITSGYHVDLPATHRLMSEAADEIDRLRDALRAIARASDHVGPAPFLAVISFARASITPKLEDIA